MKFVWKILKGVIFGTGAIVLGSIAATCLTFIGEHGLKAGLKHCEGYFNDVDKAAGRISTKWY